LSFRRNLHSFGVVVGLALVDVCDMTSMVREYDVGGYDNIKSKAIVIMIHSNIHT